MSAFARSFKAISVCLLLAGGAGADTVPARVVSMNLCTDQLAMMLAAPGQLISVSDIASDPQTSPMHVEAAAYPANYGSAEEIFLLSPDLVLAGIYSDPTVISMLRRLGLRVEQIALAEALEDIPDRIREVGGYLGQETAAETLITGFESGVAELRAAATDGPLTAFYYPNGYTLGTETLSHQILTAAGFPHLSEDLGRAYSGRLALELLVTAEPGMVITAAPYPGASRSEEILRHPVMRSLTDPHGPFITGNEWICGTPHVLGALEALAAAREERG